MVHTTIRYACFALALAIAAPAQAGIVLNTTRIIYPAKDKEVSFGVHNTGGGEILLQSWLESNAEEAGDLPFVITPALARMPGDAKQLLRILYAGSDMPQDRESVFWLNVQEIPQAANENALQIAIRQRIKVFFRPQGFKEDPVQSPEALEWRLQPGNVLQVNNPGPYYVSMVKIEAMDGATPVLKKDSQMLAPKQSLNLPLSRSAGGRPLSLSFISINDFGGQVPYRAALGPGDASKAVRVDKTDIAPH
ncbi:MAG: fimC 1 [Pseudomonas sp.]|nr:fimC 1 [Pseudomonas sp.]